MNLDFFKHGVLYPCKSSETDEVVEETEDLQEQSTQQVNPLDDATNDWLLEELE